MGLRLRRRAPSAPDTAEGVEGKAKLDRRTKNLTPRLKPGDIAVVDHDELDGMAAETLVERGVAAVVNARPSVSTRYPNLGPFLLLSAGVPVLDLVGEEVFERVREGDIVRLDGEQLLRYGEVVAEGTRLELEAVRAEMDSARSQLSRTLESFTENTLEYVRREQHILLDSVKLPATKTKFRGRYALVVTRGYHYKEDLRTLMGFIREVRPVVVAVDGAADACLSFGIKPDMIVGDVDSVSVTALTCGAEIIVHPQGDWRRRFEAGEALDEPPEVKAVKALGLDCQVITASGTSEDVAMLLAHEHGADLIVAVGSRTTMAEFLDKGRRGMASTFLVRMRLGGDLVDAKGVSRLYRSRASTREVLALVAAAVATMGIVSATAPPMRLFWQGVWEQLIQLLGLS